MLNITKFKLELVGNKCNEYPQLTILHNQQIVYSGVIKENTTLELDIDLQETNLITLQGIDKSQGKNGKWDTQVDSNGQITADKWLSINTVWVDDVSMGQEWIRSLTLVKDTNEERFLGTWWDNGSINFTVQLPLLDWIIQEKYIRAEQATIAAHDARSGDRKFDYSYIQEKIKAIQQLIND